MGFLASFIRIVWSGVRPGPNDSSAWYDRAIRVGGGLFLIGFIIYLLFIYDRSK
jgi:hypothetical protein